jgi:hypothetical protein
MKGSGTSTRICHAAFLQHHTHSRFMQRKNFLMCAARNPPRRLLFSVCWLGLKGVNDMADQSLDTRRIARDQERRIAAATAMGLRVAKPLFQYQTSILRFWADHFEMVARNYENGVEAYLSAVEQDHNEARQAAE